MTDIYQKIGDINMEWIAKNWFWVLLGIAFIAMHLFGHGAHGGHGSHGGHSGHCGQEDNGDEKRSRRPSDTGSGHHHH